MVLTSTGFQICSIIAISQNHEIVFNKRFNVAKGTKVIDYITHITGFKKADFEKIPKDQVYGEKDKKYIEKLC